MGSDNENLSLEMNFGRLSGVKVTSFSKMLC